jgi:hypothetical protein
MPGCEVADAVERSARLDRYCAEIGREAASTVRSIHLPVDYHRPDPARSAITGMLDAGLP